jgi:hypothetical protein
MQHWDAHCDEQPVLRIHAEGDVLSNAIGEAWEARLALPQDNGAKLLTLSDVVRTGI